jgi:hypothetical protein
LENICSYFTWLANASFRGCGISDIMTFAGENYQLKKCFIGKYPKKDILSSVGRKESFVVSLKD